MHVISGMTSLNMVKLVEIYFYFFITEYDYFYLKINTRQSR